MNNQNNFIGQPIRCIQICLRKIAYTDKDLPVVVPDGIFGEQTREAVMAFQIKYKLPITGEIDGDTWDAIVEVYNEILEVEKEPRDIKIYPKGNKVFQERNQASIHLYPIQIILSVITKKYTELGEIQIDGTNNDSTIQLVKKLQKIFAMPENGNIDRPFWDRLAGLYEAQISRAEER